MEPAGNKVKVLVVDDDKNYCSVLKTLLSKAGFDVATAVDTAEVMADLSESEFDVALVDRVLKDGSGIEIIKRLSSIQPWCKSILMTGYPSFQSAVETLQNRIFAYITKPAERDEICHIVEEAARESRIKKESSLKQALYQSVFDSMPYSIVVCDLSGKTILANFSFERTFGYQKEEVLGRRIPYVPDPDIDRTKCAFEEAVNEKHVPERKTQRLTKDGQIRDVTTRLSLCRDSRGEPIGIIVIIRDITKAKEM